MGTRSKIEIYENGKKGHLVTTYKQYDGYIDGLGVDIFKLLKGRSICNGYSGDMTLKTNFNGMGELACYLIKELKQDSMKGMDLVDGKWKVTEKNAMGNFYIQAKTKQLEEYNYTITLKKDEIHFSCVDWQGETIFSEFIKDLTVKKLEEIEKKFQDNE